MGIRFLCPNGHRLNVKTSLAGRRGVCPHCNAKFPIPFTSTIASKKEKREKDRSREKIPTRRATHELDQHPELVASRSVETMAKVGSYPGMEVPSGLDALFQASPNHAWYVRHPQGGQYGPADTPTLRSWFVEGRIPPDALLWRSDWEEWRRFGDLEERPSKADSPDAIVELVPRHVVSLPLVVRRKQRRTWVVIILLSVASLVMLIGLVVVLASS
jgi:GYF domain 2